MEFPTLAKRHAFNLAVALLIGTNVGCSSPGEPPSPGESEHLALQRDGAQPLPLQELVQLATLDSDPLVRYDAASVLASRGGAGSIDSLTPLLNDPDPHVRNQAISGIRSLVQRFDLDPRIATEAFIPALESETHPMIRPSLLYGLAHLTSLPEDAAQVFRGLMHDDDPETRVMAGTALASHVSDGGDIIAATIRATPPHRHTDQWLAEKVYLCEVQHLPEVRMLTSSPNLAARFLAETAVARLEGKAGNWQGAFVERNGRQENRIADVELASATWSKANLSEIRQAAGESRIVIFGEIHSSKGPIREAQKKLLRSFVRDPKFDALGYEPSVQDAQEEVLALARELGLRTISTEPGWEVLHPQRRIAARDNETAQVINDYLASDPRNRIFVIRGESHVTPGGHLAQQLTETPMIVLSVTDPPLRYCDGKLQANEGPHKIHLGQRTYSWPCFSNPIEHLQAWLDERKLKALGQED